MVKNIRTRKNEFANMIMRNAHVSKESKIFFGSHELKLPKESIEVNLIDNILHIYHEEVLKAVIDVDKIYAVISDEGEVMNGK